MKICNVCGIEKLEIKFQPTGRVRSDGFRYRRGKCTMCQGHDSGVRWAKNARKDFSNLPRIARIIAIDARKSDRKRGWTADLDHVTVLSLITQGCSYCGEHTIRMTVDRIDNSKGHTKDNLVPACIRCNYMRRNAPYEAWKHLAPALKEARELGLFGEWIGDMPNHRMVDVRASKRGPCAESEQTLQA